MQALGDFIRGAFVAPQGDVLTSHNPARNGAVVLETAWSSARVVDACEAAREASLGWAARSMADRWNALVRFRDALRSHADAVADAIMAETGKLRSEARGEAGALVSRFDLVKQLADSDMHEGPLPGRPHEQLRFHPLGVVGVIGPFNYPVHLCHAHVIPALLMGNAVVVKPSDVTPLSGQRYAEAARDAGLPPGVLNVVQGGAEAGRALIAHPAVRGLCFTGSYPVGRQITEQALDRPELLVALEMGGKNTVIVLDDASVRQSAHEIVVGGYLTTGQRCTATDRVLVHRKVADQLIEAVRPLVTSLRFGDPEDASSFAGPLSTEGGRERFEAALARARDAGAEPLVEGGRQDGGFYRQASLHKVRGHDIPGYTDTELFGPDVAIEIVEDDDEAIAVLEASAYGFANSVFTGSSERFMRIYRHTHSGILNRNRSTNLASPRLPFGGAGKSGNYRPAGAYALRNVVLPVAVQENVLGTIQVHPMLARHLPEPNLARLGQRHAIEEAAEAGRILIEHPRPMGLRLPPGGRLPRSDAWLTRLYAGERVAREKKPIVFDHLRSAGPWMVSVDEQPMSVLDGMSQTATLCGGFAEDHVVRAFVEGEFAGTLADNPDTTLGGNPAAQDLATALRHLVPGLPHVAFANSGAEANEKALALCHLHAANPAANRILAFEGSFHGRTLLALHATWSPKKREPFEIPGYQAVFAPFPLWSAPMAEEPAAPAGFYAAASAGDIDSLVGRFGREDEDPLLAAEVQSLVCAHEALAAGDVFACIIEPMQAEGGDRYATHRFFRALRLLTRYHGVALIFDEVQTGFGLGGSFAWHLDFRLVNARGQPDFPDAVTFAKRAQVGAVMSRFPDPEATAAHPASLVRGRLHAEMMSTAHGAERIEKLVKPRLLALHQGFSHLVTTPRAKGYAFAFDLPTNDHLMAYLGQRFWRGAIVFGAGTRTVRYRLSEAFLAREIEQLFTSIRRSLSWLDAHPGARPPSWEDQVAQDGHRRGAVRPEVRLRSVEPVEAVGFLPAILDIEYQIYEPARRTPPAEIRAALESPEGSCIIAEVEQAGEWRLIGFALGSPLEHSAEVEGPDRDPMLGKSNSLYSVSVTVASDYQGMGLGRDLKEAQLRDAASRRDSEDQPRFRYVTGRNRIGHTASMTHLNRAFGAHVVCVLTGQYEDPEGQAIYYRIPVGPLAPDPELSREAREAALQPAGREDASQPAGDEIVPPDAVPWNLASGLARPFAEPPQSLQESAQNGLLYGPAVNKLTVMNYATPVLVRALEWFGAMLPELPHLYLTSCRDECVDKSLRVLRWHRENASVAIGFEGGYVGHTSGASRSISDPAVHAQGPAYFAWPRVPHPGDGVAESIAAIRAAVEEAGGADRVFGLYYELIQERTGRVIPEEFWPALAELRRDIELPLVAVENASGGFRNGSHPFATSALIADGHPRPDIVIWWSGGQTGYLHVSTPYFVARPLTMVSTWDGDELSLYRHHLQLRAALDLDLVGASQALDKAMAVAEKKGLQAAGAGLYRVIAAPAGASEEDRARATDELVSHLAGHGIALRRFANHHLAVVPPLDRARKAAEALAAALEVL